MFIPYENLPPTAKVWIYASERPFSATEVTEIDNKLHAFVENWQSHQMPVRGYGKVLENQFIVLLADDSQIAVGGCSIDSSMQVIRDIAAVYQTDLFDRMRVYYKNTADQIVFCTIQELKSKVQQGEITKETIVYNPAIAVKANLDLNWKVPFSQSQWYKLV